MTAFPWGDRDRVLMTGVLVFLLLLSKLLLLLLLYLLESLFSSFEGMVESRGGVDKEVIALLFGLETFKFDAANICVE